MDWCDLSELREASGQYAQLIQHNTFGEDPHTHEDMERLHNAINNVVLSEIGNVLARYNVNRTRVIQLIETTKDIIANLKKLIGDNMHTIFKSDPDVGSVFKFCEDFDNAIREEYSKLLLRRNTDPTDGDVQANERLQLFYNGCYGDMRLEDFIYKHILNDNNGTCITVGGATFANIRRLNYLIGQCQDEPTKTIMEEIKENISIMIHLTSPLEDEFDEFESCDTIGQKRHPIQNSKTIFDYMLLDSQEQKQKLLETLHTLIDGKKGKQVALAILVCVDKGLMQKPTHGILTQTFGNIGAKGGFSNYYIKGLIGYTKEEINGIENSIRPFLNEL